MPTKNVNPATGLQVQIDELDALLDQLLKLPLGPQPVSARSPVASPDPELTSSSWCPDAILAFAASSSDSSIEAPPLPRLSIVSTEDSRDRFLEADTQAPIEEGNPSVSSELSESGDCKDASRRVVDPQQIPWIDDEPTLRNPTPKIKPPLPESHRLESPAPVYDVSPPAQKAASTGAKVEIIIGPTRTFLSSNAFVPAADSVVATGPSKLRRLLWLWTWSFDQSFGRIFPRLRRPVMKYFLGFAGLGLMIGSGFLAWQRWINR